MPGPETATPRGRLKQPRLHLLILGAVLSALIALTGPVAGGAAGSNSTARTAKPTVVLVHGAWADGSGWNKVVARLQRAGYPVRVPPNPLRSLPGDSATLAGFLSTIPGPIVLVGHSYGGMVITNAATGNPNVKALVYINAYLPRQGDTVNQLTSEKPGSALDPNTTINVVPIRNADGAVMDADL